MDLARRRLETEGLRAAFNGVIVAAHGWVEYKDHLALDVDARLPSVSCDVIRRAMPRSLAGPVSEIHFRRVDRCGSSLRARYPQSAGHGAQPGRSRRLCDRQRRLPTRHAAHPRPLCPAGPRTPRTRAFVTGPGSPAWVSLGSVSPYMQAAGDVPRGRARTGTMASTWVQSAGRSFVTSVRDALSTAPVRSPCSLRNVFLAREKTLVRASCKSCSLGISNGP